jgi:hypothetical protein
MKRGLLVILIGLVATTLAAANIVFAAARFYDTETSRCVFTAISGWLDFAWHWRMPMTISSAGSLSDYQLKITVNTASLVAAGKIQASGDDIRFTDSNGITLINYWIESGMNTASTVIWVRVPTITTGTSTVYMYYGNASAPAASNGDATFMFFDDFESGFTPGVKWTVTHPEAGTVSLSTNNVFHGANSLRITDSPNGYNLGIYAGFYPQTACVIDYAIYFNLQGSKEFQVQDSAGNIGPRGGFVKSKGGTDTLEYYITDWTTIGNFPAATWYQSKIVVPEVATPVDVYSLYFYSASGTLLAQASNARFYNNADLNDLARLVYVGTSDARTDTYLDLVKVRAYAAVEPVYSIGNEQ